VPTAGLAGAAGAWPKVEAAASRQQAKTLPAFRINRCIENLLGRHLVHRAREM
jgi:hypothetical protein